MSTLQIDLLGTSFSIESKEEQEYLNKLLAYYKSITEKLEKKSSIKNPLQIAIMSGIMICDQLYQDKKTKVQFQNAIENNTLDDEIDKIAKNLISKIDKVL